METYLNFLVMKKKSTFFGELLSSSKDSVSSKRFCGILGWIAVLGCMIYATVKGIEHMPSCVDSVMFGCVALLGVDSVTSIWKGGGNNGGDNKEGSSRKGEDI